MVRRVRMRFWIELVGSLASLALTVLTLVSKEWIEVVFHVDPDAGSGLLEWTVVLATTGLTLFLSRMASQEWRSTAAVRA